MTVKTRSQIQTQIGTDFPSNGIGTITAATVRGYETDLTDSTLFPTDSVNTNTVVATGTTTARTLAARAADVVNVLDWGAVGDGVTDDYAAIQACINANQAKRIYFPKTSAFYAVTNELVVLNWGTILQGATVGGSVFSEVISGTRPTEAESGVQIRYIGAANPDIGVLRIGDPNRIQSQGGATFGGAVYDLQLNANELAGYCLYPRAANNYVFERLQLRHATVAHLCSRAYDGIGAIPDLGQGMYLCSLRDINIWVNTPVGAEPSQEAKGIWFPRTAAAGAHPAFCSFDNIHVGTWNGVAVHIEEMDDCNWTNLALGARGPGATDDILLEGSGTSGNAFVGVHAGVSIRATSGSSCNYIIAHGIDSNIEPTVDNDFGVSIANISAGGANYAVGDTITLANGVELTVKTLSGSAVATVWISDPGSVAVVPANPQAQVSTSGVGTGATFNLSWHKTELFYLYTGRNGSSNFARQNVPVTRFPNVNVGDATGLDWYEQKFFSADIAVTFATPGDLSVVYAEKAAFCTRIGNQVFVNIDLRFTPTHTTASGALRITGLPWEVQSTLTTMEQGLMIPYSDITYPAGCTNIVGTAQQGTNYIVIYGNGSGTTPALVAATHLATTVQKSIKLSGSYWISG